MFSINGPDNIGKTTQVEMLPSRWGIQKMKGIHEYSNKLSTLMRKDMLRKWWFGTDNKDFFETIRSALKRRWECAIQSSHLAVFDRGSTMFKAVCIVRIALLNEVDVLSTEELFIALTKELGTDWPEENHAMLILYEGTIEENATRALKSDTDPGDQYKAYQVLLHQALDAPRSKGLNRKLAPLFSFLVDDTN